jgi:serine O-acetyltransferase
MSDLQELNRLLGETYSTVKNGKSVPLDLPLAYSFLDDTKKLLTLDFLSPEATADDRLVLLEKIEEKLGFLLEKSSVPEPKQALDFFLSSLPETRRLLLGTIEAILNGDPASDSPSEIVLCYPGFQAILHYRIAHLLYQMNLKVLARLIAEDAHRSTGIDINPGATIGENFFIDHGTGIVIGETAVIGNNVKLYQGVTLGALSLSRGRLLKGMKRHPTVEDGVTIYSSAAIFGGETVIGEGSTVGANVYLTHSIAKHSIVFLGNGGIRVIPKVDDVKRK